VRELVRRGHDVHVLLRDPARAWRLADLIDSSVGRVSRPVSLVDQPDTSPTARDGSGDPSYDGSLTIHVGDLVDADSVRRTFAAAWPNVVLHLATHGAYETQVDSRAIFDTNVIGTLNLLEAAADFRTELFVQTGSSSEYGFRDEPMAETDRLEPNSLYAVAKSAQTHLAELWARRTGKRIVTLRLFSVYGPWEEPTRLIPTLLDRARRHLPLLMVSPDTARDFVFVDDVVDALLDFDRLRDVGGETINLGSGVQTTMRELVATAVDLLGSRSEIRWHAYPARMWDTNRWCADPRKAIARLDWSPRHSLREGLAKTAAWLMEDAHVRAAG
jgi:nucleoside-diphosphate-sugar epimerase